MLSRIQALRVRAVRSTAETARQRPYFAFLISCLVAATAPSVQESDSPTSDGRLIERARKGA
jgi:hypothetical protein